MCPVASSFLLEPAGSSGPQQAALNSAGRLETLRSRGLAFSFQGTPGFSEYIATSASGLLKHLPSVCSPCFKLFVFQHLSCTSS